MDRHRPGQVRHSHHAQTPHRRTARPLKASGKTFRAFEVLNLGRYERQAYLNVGGRLTGKQKEQALAQKERRVPRTDPESLQGRTVGRCQLLPRQAGGRLVVVGPINLPVGRLFVEEVITECRKRGASRVDILAFEFEMGLFPAALEEAKQKGIDLAPKTSRRGVRQTRRRKGPGPCSTTSASSRPRRASTRKTSHAANRADRFLRLLHPGRPGGRRRPSLKEGKSEVVCDVRQAHTSSARSKDGVVTRDKLTKQWTDWVDYWAVDFDYRAERRSSRCPVGSGVEASRPLPPRGRGWGEGTRFAWRGAFSLSPRPSPEGGGG
jgi:adenine-specific DNA-methyltransferase